METAPTLTAPQSTHEYVVDGREAALRTLLGPDYGYAHESGLVDMFAYNPDTGEDALVHTLAGDYKPGTTIPRGFHHGPSGEALWPSVVNDDGEAVPSTRIEESSQQYYPMEPSFSFVAVGGLQKTIMQRDPETGEARIRRGRFGMFPAEYDALAVMQTIRIAKENPVDPAAVEAAAHGDKPFYTLEGQAPLIDGTSQMKVRMVIDRDSGKIVTAYPKTRGKPIMGLTEEQMWQHIMKPSVVKENRI